MIGFISQKLILKVKLNKKLKYLQKFEKQKQKYKQLLFQTKDE